MFSEKPDYSPKCVRCKEHLTYMGQLPLNCENSPSGVLEQLAEDPFLGEPISVFKCPACRKVEFFALDSAREGLNRPTECLICGSGIGPGQIRCQRCGWTWTDGGDLEKR